MSYEHYGSESESNPVKGSALFIASHARVGIYPLHDSVRHMGRCAARLTRLGGRRREAPPRSPAGAGAGAWGGGTVRSPTLRGPRVPLADPNDSPGRRAVPSSRHESTAVVRHVTPRGHARCAAPPRRGAAAAGARPRPDTRYVTERHNIDISDLAPPYSSVLPSLELDPSSAVSRSPGSTVMSASHSPTS